MTHQGATTMLPKFFSRGVGKGKGPVLYCTNLVVPAFDPVTRRAIRGEFVTRDPAPVVLRGDPERTMMLIDSIDRKWKYTSGVIAFTVADAPTTAEQELVMDDFEATAFAGLEREQYDILWVRHEHEGNVELHFVVPRMELTTQKALNIAPPGYEKTFDAWRDSLNFRFGWADPSAPERAKLVQQGDHHIKTDAARVKAGLERAADPKKDITDWLTARIGAGLVSDRAGVAASLGELGEITRQGKDYISVKPTGSDKAIRLKGVIYEQNFSAAEFSQRLSAATESKDGSRPGRDGYIDESRAGEARRELESRLEGRAQYNRDRYQKADEPAQKELGGELAADRAAEPSPGIAEPEIVASAIPDDSVLLSDHLRRELGPDALPIDNDPGQLSVDQPAEGTTSADRGQDVRPGTAPKQPGRTLPDHAKEHGNRNWLESWRAASAENFEKLRGFYDGIREKTAVWLRAAWAAISGGYAAAGSAEQCLTAASAGVIESGFALEQASRELDRHADRAVGVLKMKRTDELGTFKKQINLVEYAEANGYEIDKAESSKSSVVMRGPGSDKIIVATAEDGHGVYFSVRDDRDNGTIIDFVQSRKSMNLGEVRMELRPWIGTQRPTAKPVQRKPEAERPRRPDASSADRQAVLASWIRAERAERHPYLESRGIKPATLQDSRFAGVIKIDKTHGNAVFPHYDRQGLSGYELKNTDFTGFSKHGRKSIWYSTNAASSERLVITESAIDALSHAQMRPDQGAGYMSIGGQMSPEQVELVQAVIEKTHKRGAVLVIATDNDAAGQRLAQQIAGLAPVGMVIKRDTPQAKDWNDDLKAQNQGRSYPGMSR